MAENVEYSLLILPIIVTIGSLIFAFLLRKRILERDRGSEKMVKVSDAIKTGSYAFLKTQYRTIAIFGGLLGLLIMVFLDFFPDGEFKVQFPYNAVAFFVGTLFSLISGAIAMIMAADTNSRTTQAAKESRDAALKTAYSGGLVMGLVIVSFSILGISILYITYGQANPIAVIAFGFGASFAALFAQLGGGIYTKAADVGADLVGKIEAGIPEDDIRNPGVIADNVGDAVGDCAGRGADLFESVTGETIGGMIVGYTFFVAMINSGNSEAAGYASAFILFPLLTNSLSIVGTLISTYFVKLNDDEKDSPMAAMKGAFNITSLLNFIIIAIILTVLFGQIWQFIVAAAVGILLALVTLWSTEYYTSDNKRPVLSIADASTTGPATNIIAGLSVGMESTWAPVLGIVIALISTFTLGVNFAENTTHPIVQAMSQHYDPNGSNPMLIKTIFGIFGITVGTMAMLSVTPIVLALDGYGPIADQAGGIAEMGEAGEDIRERIDSLDAVGNTTKALAKGYGMTSAGLAALLLFQAYLEDYANRTAGALRNIPEVNLADPGVIAGLFIGAMLPFLFSSMSRGAVGRAANEMVTEIRRQFKDIPGIMEYENEPDYAACIDVSTRAALKEMRNPALLVVLMTIIVGFLFGPISLAGYLVGATASGIMLGLTLNNGGGAWDNAKKAIEAGLHGGKGSEAHHAAVVGDTVGDPSKDTSGPAIHVLIKLINTIALTLLPLFIAVNGLVL